MENETKTLYCTNPKCQAKACEVLCTFCEQRCDEILRGFQRRHWRKFIFHGYVKDFIDLFHLDNYRDEIMTNGWLWRKIFSETAEQY